jgi:hypothetical protein
MQESVALKEHDRTKRRTVADALEVVHEKLDVYEITRAEIKIHHLQLPSGECTALVAVFFPDLGCHVSLPTSAALGVSARRALRTSCSRYLGWIAPLGRLRPPYGRYFVTRGRSYT